MKVLGTSIAILVTAVATAVVPSAGAAITSVGSDKVAAAACQTKEQALGFGLNGTIKITLCPYDPNWYEVFVMTKDDGGSVLSGVTRVTGSDGTSYTGAWHYDGGQGFNEGLQMPSGGAPAGTQYCGQFFHQPSQSQPATTYSTPICLDLP